MIGIVGGVGPLAGLDLASKIVKHTAVHSDQDHVSFILLSQPSDIPDRTDYLLGTGLVNPAIAIAEKLLRLERMGAIVGVIACNTAHAPSIFDEIVHLVSAAGGHIQLIHLIRVVVAHINNRHPNARIGVLSSLGTWKIGLYKQELETSGLQHIPLPEHYARSVHDAIYHPRYGIKSRSNTVSLKSKKAIYAALDVLINSGATCIVLGCTEIPLAIKARKYRGIPLLDPHQLLAEELIKHYTLKRKDAKYPF